jgi:hypothetical protein
VGNGTVAVDPLQTNYTTGQVITLTAVPADGWSFAGWDGDVTGSDNPQQVTMLADMTVTATFTEDAEPTYRLFVPTVGNGTVEVEPSGPYTSGQVIELTAIATPGWSFANWSGGAAGSDNPQQVTILADTTVTATFVLSSVEPSTYVLTLTRVGDGDVMVEPLQAAYPAGTAITLTAIPTDGWAFVGWSGDVSGVENPKHLTITADKSITATFGALQPNACQLIVRTVGNGSVHAEPLGPYVRDQQVALTAMPTTGWQFVEWSGGVIGSANPISLTVNAGATVTATFTALPKHYLFLGGISRSPDATQGAAAPEAESPAPAQDPE